MRITALFLFTFLTNLSFSQIRDTLEAKKFWADNIQAIINLDKTKIISQTNFPLEINIDEELWSKDDFTARLDNLYTAEFRDELKSGSIDNIDAWTMFEDESDTYMLVSFSKFEEYDALVFMFKQFDGNWKLYGIDMQKDEVDDEEVEE